ncbi:MAG: NAD(P)H-hydrate dehydratase [Verrucomicrobiaceae bacterium]|nr:NAD(P)H-hydrate dehydratase [Verrucomicrobiaceae bacterium]
MTAAQMQEHERKVIEAGLSAEVLMERAAMGIAAAVRETFPQPGTLVCFCGCGNNGGDALAVGAILKKYGWRVRTRLACDGNELRGLPRKHWIALGEPEWDGFHWRGPLVLLDGLVGIGSRGQLRAPLDAMAEEMNALRISHHASTFAIDLPSGLNPDTGQPTAICVIADVTATIAVPKSGLVSDSAVANVGRLMVVPVEGLEWNGESNAEVMTPRLLLPLLPKRSFAMHKGEAGRLLIIAGSKCLAGAASLACAGAIGAGAGLIKLICDSARDVPVEVMMADSDDWCAEAAAADAVVIGPGLGDSHDAKVERLVAECKRPMVIDADALNALSRRGLDALHRSSAPRLLTPHPGEMRRLYPGEGDRRTWAESFAGEFSGHTILLKGARTVMATKDRPTRFNTTGNAGMACGGMGDVLSGVLGALLAQNVPLHDAAALGSWVLGRAAEAAISSGQHSQESLSAGIVAAYLGRAWNLLRESPY